MWDRGFTFNKAKCTVLHIAGHQDVVDYQYTIDNQTLPSTEEMNDLGITITPNFKWKLHISKITARAEKQLWMVIRALGFNAPVKAKTQAYLAMVRSVLEYGLKKMGRPLWPIFPWQLMSSTRTRKGRRFPKQNGTTLL